MMEFLKNALDNQLYIQVAEKLRCNDSIKLANLAEGQYVAKYKFDKLERKLRETAAELNDLKKLDVAALKTENENLRYQIAVMGRGIPAAKAEKYVKFTKTYVTEKIGFEAALDLMLKDFPLSTGFQAPDTGEKTPKTETNKQQTQVLMLKESTGICVKAEMNKPCGESGIVVKLDIDPVN